MYSFLIEPFTEYFFMKNALISCVSLSFGCGPVGVLLVLRRMSLMGDALSHSVLPGAAIGYAISGLSLLAMGLGGFIAGLLVALIAGLVSRYTHLREDASFAGFFLISLALGVLIVSLRHNPIDLTHVLFGSALAVNKLSLILITSVSTISLVTICLIYRPLIVECFDPEFFKNIKGRGSIYHIIFLVLVVLNLVAGFQSMGTLLSIAMMMLPAITARFWGKRVWSLFFISILFGLISGYVGLTLSFHQNFPTGPSVVLVAGSFYIISLLVGRHGSILVSLKGK